MKRLSSLIVFAGVQAVFLPQEIFAQKATAKAAATETLEQQLARQSHAELAAEARKFGSATRGAIVFHQPVLACTKCHSVGEDRSPLGPDLARWEKKPADVHLVEAMLQPAKSVRRGYEALNVVTADGKSITGLIHEDGKDSLILKDPSRNGRRITIAKKDIEFRKTAGSVMPQGLVNQLANRQQFLDLVRYLMDVSEHGPKRAKELQPPAALFALPPVPAYEKQVDHAGLITMLDRKSFDRGREIYERLCINCHGTKDKPGSLPTSLRFASGRFKNGNDPYSMYQTLTYGFGMMVPQAWMVPEQKYDVIHYIREAYLKPHNPSQLAKIDAAYLGRLPKGTTRGPKPVPYSPWANMNYGPTLIGTYEAGRDGTNIAFKGIAVQLDGRPGGVSQGRQWLAFDHDTLRVSAAWSGKEFIDYNGIMFNGRHNIHPRITGRVHWSNPTGPGWANPETGSFEDPRFRGRDNKPYGPLPRNWANYKGLFHYGNRAIIAYTVGDTSVLEMPGVEAAGSTGSYTRTFNIGPRTRDMILQVATRTEKSSRLAEVPDGKKADVSRVVIFGPDVKQTSTKQSSKPSGNQTVQFNGATHLEVANPDDFDMTGHDFTITARLQTRAGGTIFAKTVAGEKWVPDGKALFIRGGRLTFDIGWVGAVTSKKRINDGKWHDVAMTWRKGDGEVRLYVDGKEDAVGKLAPKNAAKRHKVRIGFAAPNFPRPQSFFKGKLAEVRFYSRRLSAEEFQSKPSDGLVGRWMLEGVKGDQITDSARAKRRHEAVVKRSSTAEAEEAPGQLVAGLSDRIAGMQFITDNAGHLRLCIPAGKQPLRFTLSIAESANDAETTAVATHIRKQSGGIDLAALTHGGPARWPQKIATKPTVMKGDGPFEVNVFTRPVANPWSARVRFTGLDFLPDGNRMAVCSWDGDVWMVTGLADITKGLTWQRIASGLFQPLGIKYVNKKLYVTCRDQLVILHDLNGDGETDFYENFNNDHQVTEHFHEFAMGLQTDAEGNFYYAKSARHALPALVPHHGTLLKVSKDGSKTTIIANGFRAANGVCLNPDGTFYVTDQEGHWNPKNRINRVKPGGFYGNMYGYHDVKSEADDAMEQPLCWITNAFDRSPAELLWVENAKWGPLNGSLLNLSYGYGKIFVVLEQKIGERMQGGMVALPIPQFPTGIIRGRFHPKDGQLYACGMFAWAGSQQQPGGLYRLRYTGKPVHIPLGLTAKSGHITIRFSDPVDAKSAMIAGNYRLKAWDLKRTKSYGSKHYNEHPLKVADVTLSKDRKSVTLSIPNLKATWGMEIAYSLQTDDGEPVKGVIHNTIHELPK